MSPIRTQIIAILAVATTGPALAADAQKFQTLYAFKGGADGGNPSAGLLYLDGALYGTTGIGGQGCGGTGCGTVFKVDAKTGVETVIYNFAGGTDGQNPYAGLVYQGGTLYGTTYQGGASGVGTVFSVNPATGEEQVLYSFKGGADGANPYAGLLYDGGAFYGTTTRGGFRFGTVFKIDPNTGAEVVLHSFNGGTGGGNPYGGLTSHGGAIFGTTVNGGRWGVGAIFRINLATGKDKLAYSFTGYADGAFPYATMIYHDGAFYGTAEAGGPSYGTLFRFDPETGAEYVVHGFDAYFGDRFDGANPVAGVLYEGGLLYGTATGGGAFGRRRGVQSQFQIGRLGVDP